MSKSAQKAIDDLEAKLAVAVGELFHMNEHRTRLEAAVEKLLGCAALTSAKTIDKKSSDAIRLAKEELAESRIHKNLISVPAASAEPVVTDAVVAPSPVVLPVVKPVVDRRVAKVPVAKK